MLISSRLSTRRLSFEQSGEDDKGWLWGISLFAWVNETENYCSQTFLRVQILIWFRSLWRAVSSGPVRGDVPPGRSSLPDSFVWLPGLQVPKARKRFFQESVLRCSYVGNSGLGKYNIDMTSDNCTWTDTAGSVNTLCNMPVYSFWALNFKCCFLHLCAENGCGSKARDERGYCSERHACGKLPCLRRAKDRRPGATSYCDFHICKDGCLKNGQDSTRKSFCRDSLACREPECEEQRRNTARNYCKTHECKINSCCEKARRGETFCMQKHACYHEGRDLQWILLPDGTAPKTFCVEHKCKEDGCSEEGRNPPASFCALTHACKSTIEPPCGEKRATSSEVCEHHRWQMSGCSVPSKVRNGYCDEHKCSNVECTKLRCTYSTTGLCEDEHHKEMMNKIAQLEKEENEAQEKAEEKARQILAGQAKKSERKLTKSLIPNAGSNSSTEKRTTECEDRDHLS